MIPFEELAAALEAFRRRQQMEADLNGAGSNGEGNGVSAAPPENTNEIDLNTVEEVDDSN